ncbi:Ldh family oxidoreductase [Microbacterium sp. CPCC 204701]|uniref:Ldh family oxidoreductase n=1 Tax=Microbacterium sp. CPCC 204701 TaxID=2493084 RepID=UPI0013E3AB7E|nr:Ldh family oxidoreductase [Microbacterium sp. CPCC 204701]
MLVSAGELEQFVIEVLTGAGVPGDDAATTARLLVAADARGVSTHGVIRLIPYHQRLVGGVVRPDPTLATIADSGGFVLLDGDDGLGQVSGTRAAALASDRARQQGIAAVGVRNSHHIGMLGLYVEQIARAGQIGVVMSNTAPLMAPTGSAERILGNNPLAIGVPRAAGGDPVVVDLALSPTSFGKVQEYARRGEPLPPGQVIDVDGNWITDAQVATKTGTMVPIAGHKGYGLALAVELLAGALTGSGTLDRVSSLFREPMLPMAAGHLTIVIDPDAATGDAAAFLAAVERVCEVILAAQPLPNVDGILLPGMPEQRSRERAEAVGILLAENVVAELTRFAETAGVALPSMEPA